MMDMKATDRGFQKGKFTDAYGKECSIQESSAVADDDVGAFIWLGCDDIGLKRFTPGLGWEDVELQQDHPHGIVHQANTRVHLSQADVKALLPLLQHFADAGYLPTD